MIKMRRITCIILALVLCASLAVVAYAVQAAININLPIAMPFTLLMIALGHCKTSEGKEHE